MNKVFTPKVVTGNALLSGDVVYLSKDGGLTGDIREALPLMDPHSADTHLEATQERTDEIVGAYHADVLIKDGVPAPIHFREVFRTLGPSNYPHGKQAKA